MELAPFLGWLATFLFTVCFIPQIIKTLKTKTVEGLSFWLFFIQFVANIIALWYATLIKQPPLQIKYILAIIFVGLCIAVYIRVARMTKV
jgi:uncharacterized protein with PQ loop repeat